MTETILRVKDLTTRIGTGEAAVDAVNDISFEVSRGETLALVGESGCGKSITALSVMRLLPAAVHIVQGDIVLKGQSLLQLPEARMREVRGSAISMIFQEPMTSLNPVMTIGRQISEALRLHQNAARDSLNKRVVELLDAVRIPEPQRRVSEYPHQLSGGMKQRVMIAIAMAATPELLIADEPTTALDVTIQASVLKLLRDLQRDIGMAMLFITHDLGVVAEMADRVAVMRGGEIVEQSARDEFFSKPRHPYSRDLFNSVPTLGKRGHRLAVVGDDTGPLDAVVSPLHSRESGDPELLLRVKNLKVYFPIQKGLFKRTVGYIKAVDGVSIDLPTGRTLALVGESGSGKTTVGKGILQLIRPTQGSVEFANEELTHLNSAELRKRRSGIQVVFQDPFSSMNPRMRVTDIIEEGMKAQGTERDAAKRKQRTMLLLEQVGLRPEHALRYPHEFSGGQRQRICIARALAVNPRLIICDEPTSALDVSVQAQILNLLQDLQQRMGLTYLFITHNISVVAYLAHEVAVMYQGRIVEHGNVERVLNNPEHEYTRSLLAAVPHVPELQSL